MTGIEVRSFFVVTFPPNWYISKLGDRKVEAPLNETQKKTLKTHPTLKEGKHRERRAT